jgi:hypothetical protein
VDDVVTVSSRRHGALFHLGSDFRASAYVDGGLARSSRFILAPTPDDTQVLSGTSRG